MDQLFDDMRPTTLAELTVAIDNMVDRDTPVEEGRALRSLSTLAFNAGLRNCGDDFSAMYLEEACKHVPD